MGRNHRLVCTLAVALLSVGCGTDTPGDAVSADDGDETFDQPGQSDDEGEVAQVAGPTGPGPWDGAQLCASALDSQVGLVMGGFDLPEDPVGRPGSSSCSWPDPRPGAATDLMRLSQREYGGAGFADEAQRLVIVGADESVLFSPSPGGSDLAELDVVVGDQQLTIEYPTIATTWVSIQAECPSILLGRPCP